MSSNIHRYYTVLSMEITPHKILCLWLKFIETSRIVILFVSKTQLICLGLTRQSMVSLVVEPFVKYLVVIYKLTGHLSIDHVLIIYTITNKKVGTSVLN